MGPKLKNQRRLLLKAGAASLLAPRIVFGTTPTNPDVVIIGAGVAGLEAAKTLQAKGISFFVVEANNRIGGRVHTDNDIFFNRKTGQAIDAVGVASNTGRKTVFLR
jgi:monoamine oxidase